MSRTTRILGIVFVHLSALAVAVGFVVWQNRNRVTADTRQGESDPDDDSLQKAFAALLDPNARSRRAEPQDPFSEQKDAVRKHIANRAPELARKAIEDLRERQLEYYGEAHRETIISSIELAALRLRSGEFPEAVEMLERVAEVARDVSDATDEIINEAQVNLGIAYRMSGQPAKAIDIFAEPLARKIRSVGEDHRDTLQMRALLADAHWDAGHTEQAVEMLRTVIERLARISDEGDMDAVFLADRRSMMLEQLGNFSEAAECLEFALKNSRSALGVAHPQVFRIFQRLVGNYFQSGQGERAVATMESNLTLLDEAVQPEHDGPVQARMNLISTYRRLGRSADALPHQERLTSILCGKHGTRHGLMLVTRNYTSEILMEAKKFDQAEEVLAAIREQLDNDGYDLPAGQIDEVRRDNIRRTITLYEAWDRPEDAEQWKARLRPAESPGDSPTTSTTDDRPARADSATEQPQGSNSPAPESPEPTPGSADDR